MCYNSLDSVCELGMEIDEATRRRDYCFTEANSKELLDNNRLQQARLINNEGYTTCPLCLERLSSYDFCKRLIQATGREVHDLTVTKVNLFHIRELRFGEYNHKTYNLGWGHHHCNVVVKDSGIDHTLTWMHEVLSKNIENGHFSV
ncbi:BstXI family restriction endonuclease [Phormidium pseudopriestleyi FRX01]|uniref:BstXI family restriction endonuclease n=1 Tax=Phormidium pseudopriestleyi FRX01 TaxID=1759528 RepID=A0ABS3FKT0_9CYAN|nr:BstXI family restriction endonuclease [Phormidium pseudopriestleyi FRX01]